MTKKNKNQKGDLVYIPSSVVLYQMDDSEYSIENNQAREWASDNGEIQGPVLKYKKTEKPMNVLCIGEHSSGYRKIIYESETWLVRVKDTYSAKTGGI